VSEDSRRDHIGAARKIGHCVVYCTVRGHLPLQQRQHSSRLFVLCLFNC